ncbi:MAG: hypothetical protein P1S60_17955, partial [Anaerolineae bacterium]|nr:hypothetical protein [Anaerolineae bacterium]
VMTSSAKRARLTAELVMDSCGYEGEIETNRELYLAAAEDIAEVISTVDDNVDILMLVGHNPGMEDLIYELSGDLHAMPTCAVAEFVLSISSWREIDLNGEAILVNLWVPRQL